MNNTCVGIVISNNEYKENDSLVKVLTSEYGIITFIVKGTKKMTSKRTGNIQLGNYAKFYFDYKERSGLQQLKQVELLNSYKEIQTSLLKQGIRQYVCELACKLDQIDIDVFPMFHSFFGLLSTSDKPMLLLAVFQSQINELIGIGMQVDSCVECGRTNGIQSISIDKGGFLCANCKSSADLSEEVETLKEFRFVVKCTLNDIDKLYEHVEDQPKYFVLLAESYERFGGFRLRSLSFLHTLIAMEYTV